MFADTYEVSKRLKIDGSFPNVVLCEYTVHIIERCHGVILFSVYALNKYAYCDLFSRNHSMSSRDIFVVYESCAPQDKTPVIIDGHGRW